MIRGFLYHLQLTLRLNFKSRQPLIYGYLVPVLFLIAFGAVFRTGEPPLLRQMSQLVTISALGGACFGMPTALVAERERGWWRRYRLLPHALAPLILSTLVARFVLIGSAAALQIGLARLMYGTPFPSHPGAFALAYSAVAFAFLGMGLLIAALAKDVPAVQALGQCLFLPLIMIGGVGVPLAVLPDWAQRLACFLPGKYAVESLQAGFTGEGLGSVLAGDVWILGAIGAAAAVAGARLFRWDHAPAVGSRGVLWIAASLIPWLGAGIGELRSDRWRALPEPSLNAQAGISEEQIESISYDHLPPDDGIVTPIAPADTELSAAEAARLERLRSALAAWAPGHDPDATQAVRNLISAAAVADLAEDPLEGSLARVVFELIQSRLTPGQAQQALASIALQPDSGSVVTSAEELGLSGDFIEAAVRTRVTIYAVKFLGRVRHEL